MLIKLQILREKTEGSHPMTAMLTSIQDSETIEQVK